MPSPRLFPLLVTCALLSPACSRKSLAPAQQPTEEPDAVAPAHSDAGSSSDTGATADAAAATGFPNRVIGGPV
jgi:hypothetical protein